MLPKRTCSLAVVQTGPVHLAEIREPVVPGFVAKMHEAKTRDTEFLVLPELVLTTFFPRYWMSENAAQQHLFEAKTPGLATQPLEHVFNFAEHRLPEHYCLITECTGAGERVP